MAILRPTKMSGRLQFCHLRPVSKGRWEDLSKEIGNQRRISLEEVFLSDDEKKPKGLSLLSTDVQGQENFGGQIEGI